MRKQCRVPSTDAKNLPKCSNYPFLYTVIFILRSTKKCFVVDEKQINMASLANRYWESSVTKSGDDEDDD
uniref:Uncharacterized protein n=1 Tax=Nelumbo nucifera TaxID=4432 RepID=A0A822XDP3_NELNU|nr:TPA_asm: hypothetical protein HUJ06_019485 [Nelumbo nucifera]